MDIKHTKQQTMESLEELRKLNFELNECQNVEDLNTIMKEFTINSSRVGENLVKNQRHKLCEKLLDILNSFILHVHFKNKSKDMCEEHYKDYMAALLANYVDVKLTLENSLAQPNYEIHEELSLWLNLLIGKSKTKIIDVLLQQQISTEISCKFLEPILSHLISNTSLTSSSEAYIKLIILTNKWTSQNFTLKNIHKQLSSIQIPTGFIDFLSKLGATKFTKKFRNPEKLFFKHRISQKFTSEDSDDVLDVLCKYRVDGSIKQKDEVKNDLFVVDRQRGSVDDVNFENGSVGDDENEVEEENGGDVSFSEVTNALEKLSDLRLSDENDDEDNDNESVGLIVEVDDDDEKNVKINEKASSSGLNVTNRKLMNINNGKWKITEIDEKKSNSGAEKGKNKVNVDLDVNSNSKWKITTFDDEKTSEKSSNSNSPNPKTNFDDKKKKNVFKLQLIESSDDDEGDGIITEDDEDEGGNDIDDDDSDDSFSKPEFIQLESSNDDENEKIDSSRSGKQDGGDESKMDFDENTLGKLSDEDDDDLSVKSTNIADESTEEYENSSDDENEAKKMSDKYIVDLEDEDEQKKEENNVEDTSSRLYEFGKSITCSSTPFLLDKQGEKFNSDHDVTCRDDDDDWSTSKNVDESSLHLVLSGESINLEKSCNSSENKMASPEKRKQQQRGNVTTISIKGCNKNMSYVINSDESDSPVISHKRKRIASVSSPSPFKRVKKNVSVIESDDDVVSSPGKNSVGLESPSTQKCPVYVSPPSEEKRQSLSPGSKNQLGSLNSPRVVLTPIDKLITPDKLDISNASSTEKKCVTPRKKLFTSMTCDRDVISPSKSDLPTQKQIFRDNKSSPVVEKEEFSSRSKRVTSKTPPKEKSMIVKVVTSSSVKESPIDVLTSSSDSPIGRRKSSRVASLRPLASESSSEESYKINFPITSSAAKSKKPTPSKITNDVVKSPRLKLTTQTRYYDVELSPDEGPSTVTTLKNPFIKISSSEKKKKLEDTFSSTSDSENVIEETPQNSPLRTLRNQSMQTSPKSLRRSTRLVKEEKQDETRTTTTVSDDTEDKDVMSDLSLNPRTRVNSRRQVIEPKTHYTRNRYPLRRKR